MGILQLFSGLGKGKRYLEMNPQELLNLGNEELRDAISTRMMKETERMQVRQCLDTLSGAKLNFYVVSLYEAEVSTDGLCRFLVGPSRSASGYILDALDSVGARHHAKWLRKFTSENNIDLQDLGDLRIENSWEYEQQKTRYSFDVFDKRFEDLYRKESIDEKLMQYVRDNVDQF